MNILILNWRDIKNPLSGGAEVLTHEMAEHWVRNGHTVTIFSSFFPKAKTKETINGVTIIRRGSPDLRSFLRSVHVQAYLFYRKEGSAFDIVVDEIHGMPFFTPLYVRKPIIPFICEVAKDIWDRMFPFPWNIVGRILERLSLSLYTTKHFMTISQSTKSDLISYGIPAKNISVLTMGFHRIPVTDLKKEKHPTLVFVARLNKMKGVEDAITAVSLLTKKLPTLRLWIVGRGEELYVSQLRQRVSDLHLSDQITFFDFVTQERKFELMAKAHVIVVPSLREGFGLIVPEAGSVGTPAVVYNSQGLRDIVHNGINGYKVQKSPKALAQGIEKIVLDKKIQKLLSFGAKKESEKYTWEATGQESLTILLNTKK